MTKCAECGYLTIRRNDRTLLAADKEFREALQLPPSVDGYGGQGAVSYDQTPLCFMQKVDFREHWNFNRGANERERIGHVLHFITTDHAQPCDSFTEWHFGFSPKEHVEMNLIERQREWQEKCDNRDHEWRASQEARQQEWREKDIATQERRDREQRAWQEDQEKAADTRHNQSLTAAINAAKSNDWSQLMAGVLGALATIAIGGVGAIATLLAVWLSRVP